MKQMVAALIATGWFVHATRADVRIGVPADRLCPHQAERLRSGCPVGIGADKGGDVATLPEGGSWNVFGTFLRLDVL